MVIKVTLKGGRKKEEKENFFDEVWTDGDVGRISESSFSLTSF
jgi:hypothetical protein